MLALPLSEIHSQRTDTNHQLPWTASCSLSLQDSDVDCTSCCEVQIQKRRNTILASARVADLSKVLTAIIIDPDLIAHQGPVFEVAWAHPKFGNILASCGFDNNIIFWQ